MRSSFLKVLWEEHFITAMGRETNITGFSRTDGKSRLPPGPKRGMGFLIKPWTLGFIQSEMGLGNFCGKLTSQWARWSVEHPSRIILYRERHLTVFQRGKVGFREVKGAAPRHRRSN